MIDRQRLSAIMILPFSSWLATSPITIAATGKCFTPVIMHRAIGDAMAVGIRELEKNIFIFFAEAN